LKTTETQPQQLQRAMRIGISTPSESHPQKVKFRKQDFAEVRVSCRDPR
jgi:hypothetical protein